jgi:hypothetical protein
VSKSQNDHSEAAVAEQLYLRNIIERPRVQSQEPRQQVIPRLSFEQQGSAEIRLRLCNGPFAGVRPEPPHLHHDLAGQVKSRGLLAENSSRNNIFHLLG